MRYQRVLTLGVAAAALLSVPALAEPAVVVSIKPVHGLVTRLMEGVGEPTLLIDGATSPHAFTLRPSQAAALAEADLVVWVGPALESSLQTPVANLGTDARVITAVALDGLTVLPAREGGLWEGHHHHDHGHDDDGHDDHGHDDHGHDDHGHDDHGHDDHGHDEHAHDDHGHDDHGHDDDGHDEHGHDDHAHGAIDAHVWLDIGNAQVIAGAVADELIALDPANADTYEANLEALDADLEALDEALEARFEPVADRPFLVFHDAYQYLEAAYGLSSAGSVAISPEVRPGARRVGEIQARIQDAGVVCIFREPQFDPSLISVIIEGTDVKVGEMDPLGGFIDAGATHYQQTLQALATNVSTCLSTD